MDGVEEDRLPELMLLSNSFSPGQGALEHPMGALAVVFAGTRQVLFIPYADSDPGRYTESMREVLGSLGVQVIGAHRAAEPLTPWPVLSRCLPTAATPSACCGRATQRAADRDRRPGPRRHPLPGCQRRSEPDLPDHPHH